ncbi:unnamed protein product [Musa banksii]
MPTAATLQSPHLNRPPPDHENHCYDGYRDELLSDSFSYKEIENGMLWEVEGKIDVDIGANPSQEGGEEDEGFDDTAVKVVDIVDTFKLQEQPSFDQKQFVTYIKRYIKLLTPKLEWEKQELF